MHFQPETQDVAVEHDFEKALKKAKHGESWEGAMDDVGWDDDVLVVGSSPVGPIAQVFLGSRGPKSCAAHPFPVMVLPHGQTEELANG